MKKQVTGLNLLYCCFILDEKRLVLDIPQILKTTRGKYRWFEKLWNPQSSMFALPIAKYWMACLKEWYILYSVFSGGRGGIFTVLLKYLSHYLDLCFFDRAGSDLEDRFSCICLLHVFQRQMCFPDVLPSLFILAFLSLSGTRKQNLFLRKCAWIHQQCRL